uniref:Uncharacterized protein n=1 Tax=Setaria italica TaxID=4555 RepID=K3XNV9_SETIT
MTGTHPSPFSAQRRCRPFCSTRPQSRRRPIRRSSCHLRRRARRSLTDPPARVLGPHTARTPTHQRMRRLGPAQLANPRTG